MYKQIVYKVQLQLRITILYVCNFFLFILLQYI